jgi:hypothetical protein
MSYLLYRVATALTLFILASGPAAADVAYSFAGGWAEVALPEEYRVHGGPDGSLVAVFGAGGSCNLRIELLDYAGSPGPADLAERFVRAIGEKAGRPVKRAFGKAVLFEEAGEFRRLETDYRVARWQIGTGKALFVMTLTAPVGAELAPEVADFIERRHDAILRTLRRAGK